MRSIRTDAIPGDRMKRETPPFFFSFRHHTSVFFHLPNEEKISSAIFCLTRPLSYFVPRSFPTRTSSQLCQIQSRTASDTLVCSHTIEIFSFSLQQTNTRRWNDPRRVQKAQRIICKCEVNSRNSPRYHAFEYFLSLGRLRKQSLSRRISSTGDGSSEYPADVSSNR